MASPGGKNVGASFGLAPYWRTTADTPCRPREGRPGVRQAGSAGDSQVMDCRSDMMLTHSQIAPSMKGRDVSNPFAWRLRGKRDFVARTLRCAAE